MESIYEENPLGGVTLKPNCEVLIRGAHPDLIAEMHNSEFGKLTSDEKMIENLIGAGYNKIVCDESGWTELQ